MKIQVKEDLWIEEIKHFEVELLEFNEEEGGGFGLYSFKDFDSVEIFFYEIGESKEEIFEQAIKKDIALLWRAYVLEDGACLSKGGKLLRKKLQEHFREIKK